MDVTDFDDPESADAGPLDLTPRTPRSEQGSKSSKRGAAKAVPIVLGVLVLGAIAAVLVTQLAGAATSETCSRAIECSSSTTRPTTRPTRTA